MIFGRNSTKALDKAKIAVDNVRSMSVHIAGRYKGIDSAMCFAFGAAIARIYYYLHRFVVFGRGQRRTMTLSELTITKI